MSPPIFPKARSWNWCQSTRGTTCPTTIAERCTRPSPDRQLMPCTIASSMHVTRSRSCGPRNEPAYLPGGVHPHGIGTSREHRELVGFGEASGTGPVRFRAGDDVAPLLPDGRVRERRTATMTSLVFAACSCVAVDTPRVLLDERGYRVCHHPLGLAYSSRRRSRTGVTRQVPTTHAHLPSDGVRSTNPCGPCGVVMMLSSASPGGGQPQRNREDTG